MSLSLDPTLIDLAIAWAAVCARLGPILIFTPVLGGQQVPPRFRFAAAIALAAPIAVLLPATSPLSHEWSNVGLLLLREFGLGAIFAIVITCILHAVSAAGALIDQFRGDQALSVFDPHMQRSDSPLALFFLQFGVVLFFTVGGHRLLVEGVAASYVRIPLYGRLIARFPGGDFANVAAVLGADMLQIAMRLSAPVLVVTLLVDLCLALLARIAQRIDVSNTVFAVKGSAAVVILLLAFPRIAESCCDEVFARLAWIVESLHER